MAIRLFMIFQKVIFSFFFTHFFSVLVQAKPEHICQLPPEKGPCKAGIPRYYFDPAVGECKVFLYGGCQGNENNFKTIEACEAKCS